MNDDMDMQEDSKLSSESKNIPHYDFNFRKLKVSKLMDWRLWRYSLVE